MVARLQLFAIRGTSVELAVDGGNSARWTRGDGLSRGEDATDVIRVPLWWAESREESLR